MVDWRAGDGSDRFGADAFQWKGRPSRAPRQAEDRLSLNIWAPRHLPAGGLPVLVWFNGGAFLAGSGALPETDGARLASTGMIVVTFNYRLGLFGFFAHPELRGRGLASGNQGLLDQIAALRWVSRHIAAFGGDPRRVTAGGVSAGAASIALLMASPLAEGLFAQAILQSPGAFRPLASRGAAEAAGAELSPSLDELRRLDGPGLLALTPRLIPGQRPLTAARILRPIRDGHVVRRDDRDSFLSGDFRPMPMLIGGVADEGSRFTAGWPIADLAGYRRWLDANFGSLAAEAARCYPAGQPGAVPAALAAAYADSQFHYGASGIAAANAAAGAPTYRYILTSPHPGAAPFFHGEDVPYMFGTLDLLARHGDPRRFGPADHALSDRLVDAWSRFVRTGDPNGGAIDAWPRHERAGGAYLDPAAMRVGEDWRAREAALFDAVYGPARSIADAYVRDNDNSFPGAGSVQP